MAEGSDEPEIKKRKLSASSRASTPRTEQSTSILGTKQQLDLQSGKLMQIKYIKDFFCPLG